jgi:hypothetical protein
MTTTNETMTVKQALARRIPRVRKAEWGTAYLRLPLLADGGIGPWAELYDEHGQLAVETRPGSDRVLMLGPALDDVVEPYTGAVSTFEQHADNFARGYAEQ